MGEYISQEAIKNALVDKFKARIGSSHVPTWNDAFDAVTNLPPAADVVEVVRCGECKHYNDKLEMYSDYVCTIRHYCDGSPIIVGKDDFCSSGKRKDGGQDDV